MPPVRTMPTVKPTKTERSHEENQERAYIAASRRSDRSLEARVESARRASEIHEKRTGRRLRVTEQDVINEEMYEEEDDNIPWRYRHLALLPNLSTLSPEFRRRVEAQLVLEMERSRMVDPLGQFQQPQFMNPGLMSMPQAGGMFPPSMYQFNQQAAGLSPQTPMFPQQSPLLQSQSNPRANSTLRHSPYPLPNAQPGNARPNAHHRSASIANPQELSAYQQQQAANSIRTPTEIPGSGERRMSLPPQTSTVRSSQSPVQTKVSDTASSLSAHTPTGQFPQTAQHAGTPPIPGHSQFARQYPFPGTYSGGLNLDHYNPYAPLTPTLPINTQQILGADMLTPFMDDPSAQMLKQHSRGMNQPMYSYNPNAGSMSSNVNKPSSMSNSKKRSHEQMSSASNVGPATTRGLDQTLLARSLDTNVGGTSDGGSGAAFIDTPLSDNTTILNSAVTEPGFAFDMHDEGFHLDAFNSSGHVTPEDLNNFVNDDLFGDQPYAF